MTLAVAAAISNGGSDLSLEVKAAFDFISAGEL